jgi:nitroimidazol reductase NimA-like FMN-containing flavoprotein (pyridoxamine 5'-phosphate oxidase superfamily)/8-oxo-dGTP pyrophosphatase MutT (NUDIX family)
VRRLPEKARYDEATVGAVLDAAIFGHLAGVVDGVAVSLPTLFARQGRRLLLHGSRSNALFRAVLEGQVACFSVAIFDGWRLARSGFESSVAYRSAVVFGRVVELQGDESRRALDALLERCIPGRLNEVREMSDRELALTTVVALDIDEASVKLSAGPTSDDEQDQALQIWSGVLPARIAYAAPLPSFDGAMSSGSIEIPKSIRQMARPPKAAWIERLREQLGAIEPVDFREHASIAATLDRLEWTGSPTDELSDPRHVTASAFVVSHRGVILHRHKILDIWIQPGGHIDDEESPEVAATRESIEETGLSTRAIGNDQVFHVDVHQGPRGHTHYDLRYLRVSNGEDPQPAPGESTEVYWFDFDAALERAEPSLRAALGKVQRWAATQTWDT